MTQPKISLVEVFAAPQGEGYNVGRWAIFVRLAGCPLACEFAPGIVCDTPYMKAKLKVTLDELFLEIITPLLQDFLPPEEVTPRREDAPMIIFTGGEPTAAPQFTALVTRAYLHSNPTLYIAVETNGTKWCDVFQLVHWLSVSPKDDVSQTSAASAHNPHPQQSPKLNSRLIGMMALRETISDNQGAEYRYVIAGDSPAPPYRSATRHYLSPAVVSDGNGEEWRKGFPGFAPGAVARCLDIVENDPRWRISIQTHKVIGVR